MLYSKNPFLVSLCTALTGCLSWKMVRLVQSVWMMGMALRGKIARSSSLGIAEARICGVGDKKWGVGDKQWARAHGPGPMGPMGMGPWARTRAHP